MKAVDRAVVADAVDRPQSQSMSHEGAQGAFLRLAEGPAGRRPGDDFGLDRDRRRLWGENGPIRRRKGVGLGLLPRPRGIIGVDVGIDEKWLADVWSFLN